MLKVNKRSRVFRIEVSTPIYSVVNSTKTIFSFNPLLVVHDNVRFSPLLLFREAIWLYGGSKIGELWCCVSLMITNTWQLKSTSIVTLWKMLQIKSSSSRAINCLEIPLNFLSHWVFSFALLQGSIGIILSINSWFKKNVFLIFNSASKIIFPFISFILDFCIIDNNFFVIGFISQPNNTTKDKIRYDS